MIIYLNRVLFRNQNHGLFSVNSCQQLVNHFLTIEYTHRNHVAHRDIKLENIRYNSATGVVKILDFGFATFYSPDTLLETNWYSLKTNLSGSPCYAAPEIYDNKPYDPKLIDVWSMGVF